MFFVRFNSDKTDLESTHSSNASSGIDKHQVIPPDALYSMKNSNAGYISYEAVFNDSKVSFWMFVNIVNFMVMVSSSYSILQMILKWSKGMLHAYIVTLKKFWRLKIPSVY